MTMPTDRAARIEAAAERALAVLSATDCFLKGAATLAHWQTLRLEAVSELTAALNSAGNSDGEVVSIVEGAA